MIELTEQEFRDIITGKQTYRKCPTCDNDGLDFTHYDPVTGLPCSPDTKGSFREQCEECRGLAYMPNAISYIAPNKY